MTNWVEYNEGYLGVQVILSYFVSGQVKIVNRDWRTGRALQDVFEFSAYPVSESLRNLAHRPRLLWSMSWAVMLFEVIFTLSLLDANLLIAALAVAAIFHLANACFFGLNASFGSGLQPILRSYGCKSASFKESEFR